MYFRNTSNVSERNDLRILHTDFEAVWVEMKNDSDENIVCGRVYQHLRKKVFLQYTDQIFSRISKKNNKIYVLVTFREF